MNYEQLKMASRNFDSNSFYILDEKRLKNNFRSFLKAFTDHYSNVRIAYSYKTNYIPRICRIYEELGAISEVVSGLEYDIAKKVTQKGEIIFNGPIKHQSDIHSAFLDDNIIHIDSLSEINAVEEVSISLDKVCKVGLRCYFDINAYIDSRFGIDAEGNDIDSAFKRVQSLDNVHLSGLHCHFSTKTRDLSSFELRTSKLINTAKRLWGTETPDYLDIGGGFFSPPTDELRKRFPNRHIPNYTEYGECIAGLMKKAYPKENVTLMLEPGTALVADTLDFYARVLDIKQLQGRNIAILDGSLHNINPTGGMSNMAFQRIENPDSTYRQSPTDIVGYTCMETDILYKGYEGELAVGDYLKYSNLGAYTVVFKPRFIAGQYPILSACDGKEDLELIKKAETSENFLNSYVY